MRARLLAALGVWRGDWSATGEGTKVILILLAALLLAWVACAIWFSGFGF